MKKLYLLVFYFLFSLQVIIGQTAPDFTFKDTEGIERNLYETLDQGNMVLLYFFFVDCSPCQSWAPHLQQVAADYEGYNVEIWALSSNDQEAYIKNYMNAHGYNWVTGGIEGGTSPVIAAYSSAYQFLGYPTYSVICPDRSITWDVWPVSAGFPELRNALENCGVEELSAVNVEKLAATTLNINPNPITDYGRIEFFLKKNTHVKIEVFNLIGKKVLDIADEMRDAGQNSIILDLNDVPRGQYFVRVQIGNRETRVMKVTRITP